MNVRFLKTFAGATRSAVLCIFAAVISCWFAQCQAQQSAQLSALFHDPLKQITWISGPQKINIGDFADINIPEGYRLTGAHGARIILDTLNNPVPDDVVGVLASDSGNWWAVLEYSSKGYVKIADAAKINVKSVLKAVQNQIQTENGGRAMASLNWDSPPAYDAQTHSLAWSLQVQTSSSKTLNVSQVLLGRHGFIELTAVEPYPLSAAPDLKQIAANIQFKQGERYADFQTGDKVAKIGLAEIITGEKQANTAGIFSVGFGGVAAAWIYGGLALLALGGLFFLRKKSRRRPAPMPAQVAAAVPAVATATTAPAVEPSPALQSAVVNDKKNEKDGLNGHAQPKAVPAERNGSKLHRHRRKRVFDYSKFYTNVVKEMSLHSYGSGTVMTNGKANANGYSNGHANGHANGHTNGNESDGKAAASNDLLKTEIEQLIATQKRLIEEQRCLLEQQTKLIEEKRWLIQEQTAFLKGQVNLIEGQQFPSKFE